MAKRSDQILSQGPLAAPSAGQAIPIGVPEGFFAQRPTSHRSVGRAVGDPDFVPEDAPTFVAPRYFEGAEWSLATLPPEQRAQLQLAFRNAGLFGPKEKFQLGVWDDNTRQAFKRLLSYANGTGLSWEEALNEWAAEKTANAGLGLGDDTLQVRVTNPADVRRAFDAIGPATIGRRLRPDELERYVSAYQSLESQSQASSDGTVVDPPSLQTFAADQARAADPQGAASMDWLGQADEFFQVLTSERAG